MANYYTTGKWFDDEERISRVMLHEAKSGGGWRGGMKTSEKDAIAICRLIFIINK